MVETVIRQFLDYCAGKPSQPRSPEWPRVEKEHLAKQPDCQVCGGKSRLNVHHLKPFHIFKELELDPSNLITLCNARRCHIVFGHAGDFKAYNPNGLADIAKARQMFQGRKYER